MKPLDDRLLTPIYAKQTADEPLPEDRAFHLLSSTGLMFCRNEKFFRSAVPAQRPPCELAPQKEFLEWLCPPIPQELIERAVGFFDWAMKQGGESVLLVGWRETTDEIELVCPQQTAYSYRNKRGSVYPETVKYELPFPVPDGLLFVGDVHSHCDMAAYTSAMDREDDAQFNGLHFVVGRLNDEPPEFHLQASIDGVRFNIPRRLAFDGYQVRNHDFPAEWRKQHVVELSGHLGPPVPDPPAWNYSSYSSGSSSSSGSGSYWNSPKNGSSYDPPKRTGWGGAPLPTDPPIKPSQPGDPPDDAFAGEA